MTEQTAPFTAPTEAAAQEPHEPAPHSTAPPTHLRAAVLTVSDTRTHATDASGKFLCGALEAAGQNVVAGQIVPDDAEKIEAVLRGWLPQTDLILTTGGTGLSGRDVTIPAVQALLTVPLPGFGELFRALSYQEVGGAAMLSRATGGLAGRTLLFALPGSLNAVQTGWKLLEPQLAHLASEVRRQR